MRKIDLIKLRIVLEKIKEPDAAVKEVLAAVNKDIAIYDIRKGQIKDEYEYFDY